MRLTFDSIYSESELYKAAVRLYTKPLFSWRKALSSAGDDRTLYDFARNGLERISHIHQSLTNRTFQFGTGLALHHQFNRKKRTMYIFPWEQRLVDLMLYRTLNRRFHTGFSRSSYAYRQGNFGVDRCQRRIARVLWQYLAPSGNPAPGRSLSESTMNRCSPADAGHVPIYIVKRDIVDYFGSIDHDILLCQLAERVDSNDYLFELLSQRVRFKYQEKNDGVHISSKGVPFGTAIACLFSNIYLTSLDERMDSQAGLDYFRYADDILMISPNRDLTLSYTAQMDKVMHKLRLQSKSTHELNLALTVRPVSDPAFQTSNHFRHLGLQFCADGMIGLSREKFRKICNLFRYAFRRRRSRFRKIKDPVKRAELAIKAANRVIDEGIRNVAIIDYYLKHVRDVSQIRKIDRWLAEEVLAIAFQNGHKKGHFRKLPYRTLRAMGLPSLVHRCQLIHHGHVDSPFFVWRAYQKSKGSRGAAVRSHATGRTAFSPVPEATAV